MKASTIVNCRFCGVRLDNGDKPYNQMQHANHSTPAFACNKCKANALSRGFVYVMTVKPEKEKTDE